MIVNNVGLRHAVVRHTLSHLRDIETRDPDVYRFHGDRLSRLLATFATAELPTCPNQIRTPLESCHGEILAKKSILVPVLRAGLGMVQGFQDVLPNAVVCHIGLERQEEPPFLNQTYYNRLPEQFDVEPVFVLDPMVATAQSAVRTLALLQSRGAKNIGLVCWVASPEGIQLLEREHPNLVVYTAAIDRCLNEHGYIVPGLGDAGDRINGTRPRARATV